MKKLLIFHSTIAPYRIDFFNDLYKHFDTKVCLRYENLRDQKFDYKKISDQFGFEPRYLNISFEKGSIFYSKDYWKLLDQFAPDIVFVEEFNMSAVLVLLHKKFRRAKYKVVSMCDDSYNMIADDNDFSYLHKTARKLLPAFIDELILVSPDVTNWYQDKFHKGFYFPIIRDEEKARNLFSGCLLKSKEIIERYHLNNLNVFLFVGRLVKLKNIDSIIEAFTGLDQQTNKLVIIGGGEEEKYLRDKAKQLDINVLFTGRLEGEDLYAWYNVADVFVLASYQEAFGAVTNEALLAGCFSLISKNAGSSCLIQPGENGLIFNPNDKNSLLDVMKQSIQCISRNKCGLKKNLMQISYEAQMLKLVDHLNKL